MSIEFKGLDELIDTIDSLADAEKIEAGLKKACMIVERAAKQKAPKGDTGDLRRSITSKVENGEGVVYTPLEYAPYVEYGTGIFSIHPSGGRTDVPWCYFDEKTQDFVWTSGQTPHPFMRPALDENREEIKRALREAIYND